MNNDYDDDDDYRIMRRTDSVRRVWVVWVGKGCIDKLRQHTYKKGMGIVQCANTLKRKINRKRKEEFNLKPLPILSVFVCFV